MPEDVKAAATTEMKKAGPKLTRATVARGRTVVVPHPTRTRLVAHTPEGKPVMRAETMEFGPGQEVELPVEEVSALRKLGYLVDPDAAAPPPTSGATISDHARSA